MDFDFTRKKQKLGISDLCEDLLTSILARVPMKPRTMFKCVSKSWCRCITNLRYSNPPTTFSGLVLIEENYYCSPPEYTAALLNVQDQGKECILQISLKVDLINPCLKVSFRGVLLYNVTDSTPYANITQFYVSSPVLNQCIALPPIHYYMEYLLVGLYPHQSRKRDQFNVICFNMDPCYFDGKVECNILSSDTLEWKNHCAPLYNGSIFYFNVSLRNRNPHSVYNNGKLYWLYSHSNWPLMLVYNTDGEFFKFVVLPPIKTICTGRYDLLYDSEDCLFYCESTIHDLTIWAYLDDERDGNGCDDDDDQQFEDHQLRWRIIHSVAKSKLIGQIEETYGTTIVDASSFRGTPVTFNTELQILYLVDKLIIWAYSIETRRITKVWCGSNAGLPGLSLPRRIRSFDLSPVPNLAYLNNHA